MAHGCCSLVQPVPYPGSRRGGTLGTETTSSFPNSWTNPAMSGIARPGFASFPIGDTGGAATTAFLARGPRLPFVFALAFLRLLLFSMHFYFENLGGIKTRQDVEPACVLGFCWYAPAVNPATRPPKNTL